MKSCMASNIDDCFLSVFFCFIPYPAAGRNFPSIYTIIFILDGRYRRLLGRDPEICWRGDVAKVLYKGRSEQLLRLPKMHLFHLEHDTHDESPTRSLQHQAVQVHVLRLCLDSQAKRRTACCLQTHSQSREPVYCNRYTAVVYFTLSLTWRCGKNSVQSSVWTTAVATENPPTPPGTRHTWRTTYALISKSSCTSACTATRNCRAACCLQTLLEKIQTLLSRETVYWNQVTAVVYFTISLMYGGT